MSDGKEVKRFVIPLTQGFETLVDEKWYEVLSKSKWYALKSKGKDRHVYAVREATESEKKDHGRVVRMHRFILSAPTGKLVDHINRNTLDNRESNLRVCNRSQNAINAGKQAGTSSKYKGVCYRHDILKYEAIFKLEGQNKTIGFFDKEIQAALAYDRFVMHFYGDFAYLNFPDAATCEIVADKNKTIAELRAKLDVEQFAHEYDVNQLNERVETLTKKLSNSLAEVVEVKKGNYEFSEQLAKQRYTIAELRAEVERLSNGGFVPHVNTPETKKAIDDLVDDLENVGRLRDTIARQARVIEKLRYQRNMVLKAASQDELDLGYGEPESWERVLDQELAAIELAEGEKECTK